MKLHSLSSGLDALTFSIESPEDSACDIAFQTPSSVSVGLVFGSSLYHVGTGFSIVGHFADSDHMRGAVQCPVVTAVESVPYGIARGRSNRVGPGQ